MAVTVQTVVIFFNRHDNSNFQFCNFADRRRDYDSRFCASRDYDSRFCGSGNKSGVPDGEQDKVFGAHFEDLGAKPFESLAARNPKMEMFNFPCSVGVNNLECKTWEEEQDVLPVSHESDIIVDSPTMRRRGCWDGHMLS